MSRARVPGSAGRGGRVRTALALALLLPLPLAACGKRGPPVAPARKLPAAVQDLQGAVEGDAIRLNWTLPRIRVDRSPLKEIHRTEVYRRSENGAPEEPVRPALLVFGGLFGAPPGVPGFERVADITVAEPGPPAQVQGNQVTYTDAQALTFGRRYTYVVIALDDQGRPSPPSNRVVVALAAAPIAPPRLEALRGDTQVRLVWDAPTTLADGSAAPPDLVYDVFRAIAPGTPGGRPLNLEPITVRQYVDLAVQNDVTYHYSVRARIGPGDAQSGREHSRHRDPGGRHSAGPAAGPRRGARRIDRPSRVAGRARRRSRRLPRLPEHDGGPGPRAAQRGAPGGTTYVDADVRPGQTYYYVVTAVDRSKRANESVPSPEASVAVP